MADNNQIENLGNLVTSTPPREVPDSDTYYGQTSDTSSVLSAISSLNIYNWNLISHHTYRPDEPLIKHISPTSQDFYEAFGVGESTGHISNTDAIGVVLSGIKELDYLADEARIDIDDIRTTQGTSDGDLHLETFSGITISDNNTVKGSLQELETETEKVRTTQGTTLNDLHLGTFTGSTISDSNTVKGSLQELETETENIRTTQGTSLDDTHLGTFSGITISDNNTVKGALQQLETEVDEARIDIDDIRTTQGTSDGDLHLGTFTGTTITDNNTVKGSLQELETEVDQNIIEIDLNKTFVLSGQSIGDSYTALTLDPSHRDHPDALIIPERSIWAVSVLVSGVRTGGTLKDNDTPTPNDVGSVGDCSVYKLFGGIKRSSDSGGVVITTIGSFTSDVKDGTEGSWSVVVDGHTDGKLRIRCRGNSSGSYTTRSEIIEWTARVEINELIATF